MLSKTDTILLVMKCYNALSGNLLKIPFILLAHHAEYSLGSAENKQIGLQLVVAII